MKCTVYLLQGELTSHLKYGSRGSRVDQLGWNDPETSFSKNERKKKSKLGSENQSDNPRSPWGFAKLRCFSSTVSLQPTDYCLSILRTAPPKRSHGNNYLCEMLKPSLFLGLSSIGFLFSRKSSHISPPYQNGSTAILFINFHQQRGCQTLSGNLPCRW